MAELRRIPVSQAGYVELKGAVKDGDCHKVAVPGGVSFQRGCCNYHHRESIDVTEFRCGTCEHKEDEMPNLVQDVTGDQFNEPLSSDDTSTPSFPAYTNNALRGTHTGLPKVKAVKVKSAVLARAIASSKRARQTRHGYGQ